MVQVTDGNYTYYGHGHIVMYEISNHYVVYVKLMSYICQPYFHLKCLMRRKRKCVSMKQSPEGNDYSEGPVGSHIPWPARAPEPRCPVAVISAVATGLPVCMPRVPLHDSGDHETR